MELLNVNMARSIWLLDIPELNPRGKTIMPELLEWLKDNYNFEKAPSKVTELDESTKALTFERGTFQIKEEVFVDVALKVFNDGLVAETQSSTRNSEAFVEDILNAATKEFSLAYKPRMVRHKLYFSEIYVFSEKTLESVHPGASEFAAKITNLLPSKLGVPFQVAAFSFWPTQSMAPPIVLGPFRFERKLHTQPTEGKYYSTAPLHTDDHLRLLDEFESVFMS
jgi:hypothetical protein